MHAKTFILILMVQLLGSCAKVGDGNNSNSEELVESNVNYSSNEAIEQKDRFPLLVSSDFGKTWLPVSESLPDEIQVSFMEQKENEMVLASDNMGIYISEANKSKWKAIGNELPAKKINALHISGEKIYAGVYRRGIYESNDEGLTWESLNYDLPNLNVQAIFQIEAQLLVGTDQGIFAFEEETSSWKATNVRSQVLSICQYGNKLIAGTSQGTLLSKDKGNNWESIRKAGAVHYTRNIGNRVIELALNGDIVYTDDWGESWRHTQYGPRNGSYVYDIIECGDYQIISNNYGVHRSNDNGVSWEHVYKTESMAFFDLISVGNNIYGGTRRWDEYRKREK